MFSFIGRGKFQENLVKVHAHTFLTELLVCQYYLGQINSPNFKGCLEVLKF